MPILALLAPLVNFVLREVVVKFVILTVVFAVLAVVVPMAINYVLPFVGGSSLTSAFNGLDGGVWYFLDFFALDYGLPLILSAYVARFLIRRLPFIG